MWQMHLFEEVSRLHMARHVKPKWGVRKLNDPKDAMIIFLEGYAFERQGRDPSYPHIAIDVVGNSKSLDPKKIWRSFSSQLNGVKLNEKNNPLYHEKENCCCVICTFGNKKSIITSASDAIKDDKVSDFHTKLCRVRGTGPKIASLFLRDVAMWFSIIPKKNSRVLLQPVDVWIKNIVIELAPEKLANDLRDDALSQKQKTEKIQSWICEHSKKSCQERVNQGMWYFGAHIAASQFRMRKAMLDKGYADSLVEQHLDSLQSTIQAWNPSSKKRNSISSIDTNNEDI